MELDFRTDLISLQSKSGILSKTCDYILDLQKSQQDYAQTLSEIERLQEELDATRMQVSHLLIPSCLGFAMQQDAFHVVCMLKLMK